MTGCRKLVLEGVALVASLALLAMAGGDLKPAHSQTYSDAGFHFGVSGSGGGGFGGAFGVGGGAALRFSFLDMGGVLDPKITFSRGSSAMQYNASGVLEWAPENLWAWSDDFALSRWNFESGLLATVADSVDGPAGRAAADKIVEDTGTTTHGLVQVNLTQFRENQPVTASVSVKAAGRDYFRFRLSSWGSTNASAIIDLTDGTVLDTTGMSAGSSVTVTAETDGFYRVSGTVIGGATGANPALSLELVEDSATLASVGDTYTGDGTSGVYLSELQVSHGSAQPVFLATAGAEVQGARFTHDPATFAPRGFLVEAAATNLALRSAEFDDATWVKNATASATANTMTSPDGTANADTLTAAAANDSLQQNFTIADDSTEYVASIYLKQGTAATTQVKLQFAGGTGVDIDPVITWSGPSTNKGTLTNVGGGWYRLEIALTNNGTGNTAANFIVWPAQFGGATGTVGAFGAQFETGNKATSYIATAGSTATRAADVPTITGSRDLFTQADGTILVNYRRSNGGGTNKALFNGNASVGILYTSGTATLRSHDGSTTPTANVVTSNDITVRNKAGVAWSATSHIVVGNGVLSADEAGFDGTWPGSGDYVMHHGDGVTLFESLEFFVNRVSDISLQQKTTE